MINLYAYQASGEQVIPISTFFSNFVHFVPNMVLFFVGLAIGNGLSDPVNMLNYSAYLYQIGLIDAKRRSEMEFIEQTARNEIANERWTAAFLVSCCKGKF